MKSFNYTVHILTKSWLIPHNTMGPLTKFIWDWGIFSHVLEINNWHLNVHVAGCFLTRRHRRLRDKKIRICNFSEKLLSFQKLNEIFRCPTSKSRFRTPNFVRIHCIWVKWFLTECLSRIICSRNELNQSFTYIYCIWHSIYLIEFWTTVEYYNSLHNLFDFFPPGYSPFWPFYILGG